MKEELTRPERMLRAKQLRAQIQALEQKLVELRREYRRYSPQERVDWKDNNDRVAALNRLIERSGLLRKHIAAYVGITQGHLSVVLTVKRARLTRQLEQDIRSAVAVLERNRRIEMK